MALTSLQIGFEFVSEDKPGDKLKALFDARWGGYKRWYLSDGDKARPRYLSSRLALQKYMPELLPVFDQIVDLAGGGNLAARFLSLYCPPSFAYACSQAIWPGPPAFLIRNYDYSPALLDGFVLETAWHGKRVMAMGDCLWGVLDGINEDGLAVSLSFGGRRVVGDGFGIALALRYVLEFCRDVQDATAALQRIPVHMSYNITLLDRGGQFRTLYVAPDHQPIIRPHGYAANHQERIEWAQHALATRTLEREQCLAERLAEEEDAAQFVESFLKPPLYSTAFDRGFGTLYTAQYYPDDASACYLWPEYKVRKKIGSFDEETVDVDFRKGEKK